VPSDALTFGRSVGFGDVDGDSVGEVLIGDVGSDEVYVYHSADSLPDKLASPAGGDFGQSIAVGGGALYIGADAVSASKQERNSGGVYQYALPLLCKGGGGMCSGSPMDPIWTRSIKNEELGHRLALVDGSGVAATPGISGTSIALFPSGASLPVNPDFGLMDNVSAGDMVGPPDAYDNVIDEIATGTSNAGPDSGNCGNVGAVSLFVNNESVPLILRTDDAIGQDNLFFGRSTAIAGGYLFVGEMGRDIDNDGTRDGQIYVFTLQ
jgi:hypothetical protein